MSWDRMWACVKGFGGHVVSRNPAQIHLPTAALRLASLPVNPE